MGRYEAREVGKPGWQAIDTETSTGASAVYREEWHAKLVADALNDAHARSGADELAEALEEARAFVADQFADQAAAEHGEWLDKDARATYQIICEALKKYGYRK